MVAFVILHFNDIQVTQQCIEHLLGLDEIEKSVIIVVDNGSPNGSGHDLEEIYRNHIIVKVLLTHNNIGFAKGNNFGYIYAKKTFSPDYIVVMNNDVMIEQKNFITMLSEDNYTDKYEVIMPDIINKLGIHQNPFREKPLSRREAYKNYYRILLLFIIYHFPIVNVLWCKRKKVNTDTAVIERTLCNNEMMVPHGACVIYTKRWIKKENIAFVPDTFLYGEEDILYEYILNKKYKTFYADKLHVNHLEDVATTSIANTDLKKAKFLFKNSLKSQKVFRKIRAYNASDKAYVIREEK